MEKAYGIVKNIKGDIASVLIRRDSMCSDNCASCGLCSMKETVVSVKNPLGAKVGEKVEIKMEQGGLLAAFLVYGMPVLLILFGVILSISLKWPEIWGLVIGIVLIAFWYIAVKILEKCGVMKGRYGAEITEIIYVDKESEAE